MAHNVDIAKYKKERKKEREKERNAQETARAMEWDGKAAE